MHLPLFLLLLLLGSCLPAVSGLGFLRSPSFAFEVELLRMLSRGGGAMDERDLHIRYSDSPSGVLRYAAARGQPVAEVASLLVEQYDADPRGMQARAAAASARVSAALESPETRRLRVEQLEAPVDLAANGGSVDGEKTGRLYYSAILAAAPCLSEFGLPQDVLGLCALLALSRAAVRSRWQWQCQQRLALDAAVTDHFHAVRGDNNNGTTDGRFSFVERFWEPPAAASTPPLPPPPEPGPVLLVVAFASLGDGIVRLEWRRALRAALDREMANAAVPIRVDVLFVADPAVSWYCTDAKGRWDGGRYFEERLARFVARRHCYDGVLLLGDSMGGSAALRFASSTRRLCPHCRVRAVAFVPQVNLVEDRHCVREDFSPRARRTFQRRLLRSVQGATAVRRKRRGPLRRWVRSEKGKEAVGGTVVIHRGTDRQDAEHASLVRAHRSAAATHTTAEHYCWAQGQRLPASSSSSSSSFDEVSVDPSGVVEVEHEDCAEHLLTSWLKGRGELDDLIGLEIRRLLVVG
jgi:hypothetical protein